MWGRHDSPDGLVTPYNNDGPFIILTDGLGLVSKGWHIIIGIWVTRCYLHDSSESINIML